VLLRLSLALSRDEDNATHCALSLSALQRFGFLSPFFKKGWLGTLKRLAMFRYKIASICLQVFPCFFSLLGS